MEDPHISALSFTKKAPSPFDAVAEEPDRKGGGKSSDVEESVDDFKGRSVWKSPMVGLKVIAGIEIPAIMAVANLQSRA